MDPRLQRRVQRYGWDRAAPYYEQFWAAQLAPAHVRMLEMAALQPGDSVVDVACGTGLVTFRAAEAVGLSGRVVATDISDEMVRSLRYATHARGVPNVSAERMDAEELNLPDASFDVALCALGLMYVPDPVLSLREMARVVKPRGRIVAAVWGARDRCGWAEIFPIVERRVASDVCPLFFQLGTGDALRLTMQQAGLTDIALERIQTTLHFESAEAACGAAFAGGPLPSPTRASMSQPAHPRRRTIWRRSRLSKRTEATASRGSSSWPARARPNRLASPYALPYRIFVADDRERFPPQRCPRRTLHSRT